MRFARRLRRGVIAALLLLVIFVMGTLVTRQPGTLNGFSNDFRADGVTRQNYIFIFK
jgi:hypothetical protein